MRTGLKENIIMDLLKNYIIQQTDDGTETLFSTLYNEACHSNSGAVSETRSHYIQGCNVINKAKESDNINVFEVGFGTGIGFETTLLDINNTNTFLNYISTEIDEDLVEYYFSKNLKKEQFIKTEDYYQAKLKKASLTVLLGNARQSVNLALNFVHNKFDCIYQDPFSPKRNAILWTREWFEQLKRISKESCVLATYSSSSSIRKSLLAAGWTIENIEGHGKKRTATVAKLIGKTSSYELERLSRSPVIMITDDNYEQYTIENTHVKNKSL